MLRSMTGYGCSERTDDEVRVRVEMRSVNQRFLDVQVKAPRAMLQVEDRVRGLVESRLSRGRVTVYIEWKSASELAPTVNIAAAREIVRQLRRLGEELSVPGDVDLPLVARFPQVFEQDGTSEGADEVWSALEPVAVEALAGLVAMREAEGSRLRDELAERLDAIETIVASIERMAPDAAAAMQEKLRARLGALLDGSVPVD